MAYWGTFGPVVEQWLNIWTTDWYLNGLLNHSLNTAHFSSVFRLWLGYWIFVLTIQIPDKSSIWSRDIFNECFLGWLFINYVTSFWRNLHPPLPCLTPFVLPLMPWHNTKVNPLPPCFAVCTLCNRKLRYVSRTFGMHSSALRFYWLRFGFGSLLLLLFLQCKHFAMKCNLFRGLNSTDDIDAIDNQNSLLLIWKIFFISLKQICPKLFDDCTSGTIPSHLKKDFLPEPLISFFTQCDTVENRPFLPVLFLFQIPINFFIAVHPWLDPVHCFSWALD